MRQFLLVGIAAVVVLMLAACAPASDGSGSMGGSEKESVVGETVSSMKEQREYHKITAEEAKQMIDEGSVTVVDVRTQEEYDAKHIPGAILVPNESIGSEQPEALPDKEAVLLIHCRTGIRSKQASEKLVSLGYTHVYDFGGIESWPYDTVSETGE